MPYLVWALVAMLAYSLVAPFVRRTISGGLPEFMTLAITTTILGVGAFAVMLCTGTFQPSQLGTRKAIDAYWAGLFLTIGIVAYYRALALGPVSVVVPIFGLFLVVSPLVGVFLLGEAISARQVTGIVLAAVAAYLVAG